MRRPTIADLAGASGVSVSTVNRLLHGTGIVRGDTIDRIALAAEEIGFYGLGALRERKRESLPARKLGFLLQQSHRPIYQMFGESLLQASKRRADYLIRPHLQFEDDLAPEAVAENLIALGSTVDAVAVIAADHPLINQAVDHLSAQGVPVVTYITDLSSPNRAGHVGTNNWKLGRTAAWFISGTARQSGTVAAFVGNHRYQCQDIADASFRSYFREKAPQFVVSEAIPTHEDSDVAYKVVKQIAVDYSNLVGIFVSGGGISGVLRAMREMNESQRSSIRLVCRDIGPETRKGLTEGLIVAALCHPVEASSEALIDSLLTAVESKEAGAPVQKLLPFEIVTPESV
ncbi:MAG: LacI family DNA-binding transcriptional regulator [Hyphomicrobiaceae bacterium]|nr:LacI family DNA-binding transcriptional regulator [Hyphomicrobiaceae bacterium]